MNDRVNSSNEGSALGRKESEVAEIAEVEEKADENLERYREKA